MKDWVSCNCVLQLLMLSLLLSTTLGDPQAGAESHATLSCKTREVILSLNRTLAPLRRITFSHNTSIYPATNIYNFGYYEGRFLKTWCTVDFEADPFIVMELTQPVLITQILFSGRSDSSGSQFYVTNLTLEYSPPDSRTILNYYTTETGDTKYFTIPHLNAIVRLERPFLTERIRLRPVEWFDSNDLSFEYICLGVGLYGCLATEAINLDMTSMTVGEQSTSQALLASTDNTNINNETAAQITTVNVVRDCQALAIVLPIALLSIAINAVFVGMGVYICVFLRRQKETNGEEKNCDHRNLEWSSKSIELAAPVRDNTLTDREGFDRRESIDKLVNNPIYGSSPLPQSDRNINRNIDIYTYEPIEHDEGEEWSDNLAYGKVESQDEATEPRLQCAEVVFELQGNKSYTPVPSISALEEEWSDNLAYGKVESQDEATEPRLQCAEVVFELQGNESYTPVPSVSALEEEWSDNLAYGKVESQDEATESQLQCEAVFELKGNESYNSVPSIIAQDEGEYSHTAISYESPAHMD